MYQPPYPDPSQLWYPQQPQWPPQPPYGPQPPTQYPPPSQPYPPSVPFEQQGWPQEPPPQPQQQFYYPPIQQPYSQPPVPYGYPSPQQSPYPPPQQWGPREPGPYQMPYPQFYPPQPQPPPVYIVNQVTANATANASYGYRRAPSQVNFLVRLLYFCFIGCWLGLLWVTAALFLICTILGAPLGFVMLNSLPAVLTLHQK